MDKINGSIPEENKVNADILVENLFENQYTDYDERLAALRERSRLRRLRKKKKRERALVMSAIVIVTLCCYFCGFALGSFIDFDSVFTLNIDSDEISQDDTDAVKIIKLGKKSKNKENDVIVDNSDNEQIENNDFLSVSYSKSGFLQRYFDYAKNNPEMSAEEVVWRVNAYQDYPKYEFDIPSDSYDDPYIIVNKYYKVPDGYRPPDLEDYGGHLLRKETGDMYMKMREAAASEGFNFYVVSAYRSVEYQRNLYNGYLEDDSRENVDRYSARPGYSEHHTGMALDVFGSSPGLREFENTPEYPWVRDNAHKYGFIIRYFEDTEDITGYESEPWHLRYIGVEAATDMYEKGIRSFEEYHAKYLEN